MHANITVQLENPRPSLRWAHAQARPTLLDQRKLGVYLHFANCRHGRAFRRNVAAIGRAVRALEAAHEAELPSGFEPAVVQRLLK